MKHKLSVLFLLFALFPVLGQDLISTIMERNPFDPKRGQKEAEEVEEVEEEVPADLPLCDGTLIIGEERYAMFTFLIEGEQVSKTLAINESSNGYMVKEIEHNRVTLQQANKTHTIKLFFQEGKMESRGGSRKATKRAAPAKREKTSTRDRLKESKVKTQPPTKTKTTKKTDPPRIVKRPESKSKGREKRKDF